MTFWTFARNVTLNFFLFGARKIDLVGLSQKAGVAVTLGKIGWRSTVDDVEAFPGPFAGGFWPDALLVDDVTGSRRDVTVLGGLETKNLGKSLLRQGKTSCAFAPVFLHLDGPLPLKKS